MKSLRFMLALIAVGGLGSIAMAAPAKLEGGRFAAQAKINLATARLSVAGVAGSGRYRSGPSGRLRIDSPAT